MTPLTLVAHNGARVYGGAERYLVRLLRRLQDRGHRVVLLCRDETVAGPARALGVATEIGRVGGHASLHHAARLAAQLRRHRPDAVLLGTFKKTWLGAMGARLARVPRVVARIGLATDMPSRSVLYQVAFRRWIDRVVVNATDLTGPVWAALEGAAEERVVLIRNAVDAPARTLPAGALRRQLGIPAAAPVVGAVARLVRQKRLELLVRGAARLEGVCCVIAGDGPERAPLERLAAELGIGERVRFLGHREAIGDVLDALDLFVVTSHVEGMSNAMLEALAAGVPVLSTPVSGAAEALEPLDDGRVPGEVVAASEEALAGRLRALLGDPAALASMGAAARTRALERFAWPDALERWEAVLSGAPLP
ncbi:MAG: glycosyltransferase family 1 protein [Gemmatimonadetes bacterium]|nr:glycosyltransferase family 1 protein [Gemmatimonadota bacterium]